MEYENKTPGELAKELLTLAYRVSSLSDELSKILRIKDVNWGILRDTVTSDKQADQLWRQREEGRREQEILLSLKTLRIQMSSIKEYLRVKENEARSLY